MSRNRELSPRWSAVVIIGAPRSGTNMLRDVLTYFPGVETWPCDEINYIWRHGNMRYPSDKFTIDMARPCVISYIRRCLGWVSRNYKAEVVVEKTCANSLRVGFVDKVIPDARYVFIRRDPLDVVGSAMKRWTAELDITYVLRKARFIPIMDFPYYATRYFGNRIYRLVSKDQRLTFWGPKLDDMDELLAKHSLEEVCALQWKRCVDTAAKAFSKVPGDRWVETSYEDFVRNPENELMRLTSFLGINVDSNLCRKAVAKVTTHSIGKGRNALGQETIQRLMPIIQDTMERYGYV